MAMGDEFGQRQLRNTPEARPASEIGPPAWCAEVQAEALSDVVAAMAVPGVHREAAAPAAQQDQPRHPTSGQYLPKES
jgi:hypothetical protein